MKEIMKVYALSMMRKCLPELGLWLHKYLSTTKCKDTGLGGKEALDKFLKEGLIDENEWVLRKTMEIYNPRRERVMMTITFEYEKEE